MKEPHLPTAFYGGREFHKSVIICNHNLQGIFPLDAAIHKDFALRDMSICKHHLILKAVKTAASIAFSQKTKLSHSYPASPALALDFPEIRFKLCSHRHDPVDFLHPVILAFM